jgi:alpha-L-fucosidase
MTTAHVPLELPRPVRFEFARLREAIRLGQRVEGMAVDAFQHGEWATVAEATSVGACRICRTSNAVETDRVRLRIPRSPV